MTTARVSRSIVRDLERAVPNGSIPVNELEWQNQVRDARLALDMTQDELSMKAGLHRKQLVDIEVHNREPSMRSGHMQRIAEALGLPMGLLFWYRRGSASNDRYMTRANRGSG